MARANTKRPQRNSKKPDKKQLRKKEGALVRRCVEALNSNAPTFRAKLANHQRPAPPPKTNNDKLKHFKPIRIDTVSSDTLKDAAEMLESKFSMSDNATSKAEETKQ